METEIIPATLEHVHAMAGHIRPADTDAAWAALGLSTMVAAERSIELSVFTNAWIVEGRPVCLFGVGAQSFLSDTGIPWVMVTRDIEKHRIAFLRQCRYCLREMLKIFPHLVGWVDVRNRLSIKWIAWMGFTVSEPEPFGEFAVPMHKFEMRA